MAPVPALLADPPLPGFAQIEPVGRCNLACPMCAVTARDDGASDDGARLMPYERFLHILDGLPGLTTLHLQGLGEPLLHPRFFDMVAHASVRGIRVSTNTNLTLLTPTRAQRCVDSGLTQISVSIDAADPGIYARIRVGATLAKVRRNLDRLQRACAAASGARPEVRIVMVLMRRNLGQLVPMVRLAHEHGIGELFVQRLSHDLGEPSLPARYIPIRTTVEREQLQASDRAAAEACFSEARDVAARLQVAVRLPRLDTTPRPDAPSCDWPERGAYIAWNGAALPCCMVSTPDRATLGRVDEHSSFASLWTGDDYRNFRNRLAGSTPPEVCAACSVYRGTF